MQCVHVYLVIYAIKLTHYVQDNSVKEIQAQWL